MKDNLIDEERAKQEEAAQETLEQKIDRLGNKTFNLNILALRKFLILIFLFIITEFSLENMSTRFSRLVGEYSSFQTKVKQRLAKLEVDTMPT